MFDLKTLNDVLLKVTARGTKQVLLRQDVGGAWKPITSAQLYGRVRALAEALQGWGVGRGDRVAIMSENRWEWVVTDFATLAVGAADVPLYGTLTAEQVGYMLRDSGAKVAFVSNGDQYAKLRAAGELPALEHVVVMDAGEFAGAEGFGGLLEGAEGQQGADAAFDTMARGARPDDLATIMYTSGTTGEPKGVALTHGNFASNLNLSTDEFGFNDADSSISYLPLSHVTARHLDYVLMCHGVRIAHCPKFDEMPAAMKATRPTIFVGVPRVYEKIRHAVEGKSAGSPIKLKILHWAMRTGAKHRAATLAGERPSGFPLKIADRLVYSKIREAFGGCVHTWVAGGAPLGHDTAHWYADVGIQIFEGYGLTETSPVIGLCSPKNHRLGTVGKPLGNLQVRFAADGELEVKGPSVFHRYWGKEKETAEAFTADGFFKTGDIGELEDGFLRITDRKKEMLKTSGGKQIAPQPIENRLKAHALVSSAAMVGDKHKFVCVLLSPNFPALEHWAKAQGVLATERGELVRDQRVVAEYARIVDEVNAGLANFETMKRFAVVAEEWTVEAGEMTPSMKLKRRVVERKYAREIAEFYADEAVSKG